MPPIKYAIYLICTALVSACATTPPSKSQFTQLNVVDRSVELGVFGGRILEAGNLYLGVKAHSVTYEFNCSEENYKITFASKPKGAETFTSQVKALLKDTKNLKLEKIKKINEDISLAELVGPVGLRCASNKAGQVHLTVNIASNNNDRRVYDFSNRKYILSAEDFE